jgi:integrase
MKIPLNQDVVLRMSITSRPILKVNKSGKASIVFESFAGSEYIIYDSSQNSPRGFGVRVGKTSKRYIVQRKIGDKITKWVVAGVGEMNLDPAREKARLGIQESKRHGETPTKLDKKKAADEITLGECFDSYAESLQHRSPPAKTNSFKSLNAARNKFSDWENKRVKAISAQMVLARFDEVAELARTAAENAGRWAMAAVAKAIELETHNAASTNRDPILTYNPFTILKTEKRFRSRATLEQEYKRNGIRNPMDPKENLGKWIQAVWRKKLTNPTGADFLILTLLWGMRRGESCCIRWHHRITDAEAQSCSFVDLKNKRLFIFDPKNRLDHELPLGPCAMELLTRREELSREFEPHKGQWVFPARSPASTLGHYSDPQTLLRYVREEAGIDVLRPHDLRRTFGRVTEELGFSPTTIKRLLNHSTLADSTSRYTDPAWTSLQDKMMRIEEVVLGSCPDVYNALRPIGTMKMESLA